MWASVGFFLLSEHSHSPPPAGDPGLRDILYWFPVATLTNYHHNRNVFGHSLEVTKIKVLAGPLLLLRLSGSFHLSLAASGGSGHLLACGRVLQSLPSSSRGFLLCPSDLSHVSHKEACQWI